MKMILIFRNSYLFKQFNYTTKKEAINSYKMYKKYGVFDLDTLELYEDCIIELL